MLDRCQPTAGISSRRSACDRCRVQKLRCLRQRPDQARWDRCNHADSECVTSPIYRMRAWNATSEGSATEAAMSSLQSQGGRKRQRQEHHCQQLPTPSHSNGALDSRHTGDSPCTIDPNPFDENAFSTSAYVWPNELPPRPVQDQVSEAAGLYDSIFGEGMDQYGSSGFGLTGDHFEKTTLQRFQTGESLPSAPTYSQSLGTDNQYSARSTSNSRSGSPAATRVDAAGSATSVAPIQDKATPLQQLSRVDYNLITLLSCLGKGLPQVAMDTLVSPVDASKSSTPAVDDILNTTREFVDVLKILSGQQASPKSFPVQTRESGSNDFSSTGDRSDDESDVASSPDSDFLTTPSPPRSTDIHSNSMPDTASLIAVLSSYIRVIRLHLIIFAHIYDYLKEISESDDPVLCHVPGLSFCTFPIQSGNLQTIILIQVVTSLFERVESLLGLPHELRLSTRREEPQGLFHEPGFMDIAGPIMKKEEGGEPHQGRGGIKCLRKYIKKTKQLLRNRIAP
ncbi:hypothetical protein JX265_006734 [Neoarthrinium moseri]|uniref:Zn(2)-C6 fungal-type domain-containing protein n=1 Tax=Neoarthrinium moseri TaxID=1658444 RepID=A0A9P9WKT0_9PEZI|nr:hypothetical protein JX265_006734 [Neoarthrinium moseri]